MKAKKETTEGKESNKQFLCGTKKTNAKQLHKPSDATKHNIEELNLKQMMGKEKHEKLTSKVTNIITSLACVGPSSLFMSTEERT